MILALVHLGVLGVLSTANNPIPAIQTQVQKVLDLQAEVWNTSFSFGYSSGFGSVALVAGTQDIWAKTPMKTSDMIPMGSVTKSWTTIAIMQYAEKGVIDIQEHADKYLDPVLSRLNGTSFTGLFGPKASGITIHHLLSMTSGIGDYNDVALFDWTVFTAAEDFSPFDYLAVSNKTFACDPGDCVYYSSINFQLLGLILVGLSDSPSWEDFDQRSIIPPSKRDRFEHTTFPKNGRCTSYPTVAHQYTDYLDVDKYRFYDMIDDSCLNGWTCGNIASTGADISNFYYDIFQAEKGGFVSSDTLKQMTTFREMILDKDWCPNCYYGMGLLFGQSDFHALEPKEQNKTLLIGHPGEDWGSGCAPVCGFNTAYNFSICIAYNSYSGMNCSVDDLRINDYMWFTATCTVYSATLVAAGGPQLNCTLPYVFPPPKIKVPCEWNVDPPPPREWDDDDEWHPPSNPARHPPQRKKRRKRGLWHGLQ
jgi:CubicO group peptidase (beta-lactamase class C family)